MVSHQEDDERVVVQLRDGTRVRVETGAPTEAELAAIVAALDATSGQRRQGRRRPAWQTAARLEAVGKGNVATLADLRDARRPH